MNSKTHSSTFSFLFWVITLLSSLEHMESARALRDSEGILVYFNFFGKIILKREYIK